MLASLGGAGTTKQSVFGLSQSVAVAVCQGNALTVSEDSEGALFVIADIFQWKEQVTRHSQKFEATGEVTYWRAEEVIVQKRR